MTPDGYIHLLQDKSFLLATFPSSRRTVIGEEGRLGRRHTFGPLCIEYYTGDIEPKLEPFRGLRLVLWTPVTRTDRPHSWIRLPENKSTMVYSFLDIRGDAPYWKTWSQTFKNYRNKWSNQSRYSIREVMYDEYRKLYREYGAPEEIVNNFEARIDRHHVLDETAMQYYVLEDIEMKEIVAGISAVDCLSITQSYYLSAFTRKDIAPPQTGLWLCNRWIEECKKRNIGFANLGIVWIKGHSMDWKGFSDFKMKFNPIILKLQRDLLRVTFSLYKK